jgi:hypothetical protein
VSHTPGPWTANDSEWPDVWAIQTSEARSAIVVAEVYEWADARLIAAAPEMAGTLQSVAETAEHVASTMMIEGTRGHQIVQNIAVAARAALAKAAP